MELFASMGGAPLPLEGELLLGGIFLILPLVVLLGAVAAFRKSPKSAYVAILLAGVPLFFLILIVTGYEPSDHEVTQGAQTGGRMAVCLYGMMTVGAFRSLWLARTPNMDGPDNSA